jgi:hypothetical protein
VNIYGKPAKPAKLEASARLVSSTYGYSHESRPKAHTLHLVSYTSYSRIGQSYRTAM